MKQILLLLLLCGVWGVTPAQQLIFASTTAAVGALSEDDAPRKYTFRYANRTSRPVVILRVATTCGCAQPSFTREPVAPGDEGEVGVVFYPRGHSGTVNKSVFVYTSASREAVQLTLTGEVTPTADRFFYFTERIGDLRLKSREVNFRRVDRRFKTERRVEVANAGSRPLRLEVLGLPSSVAFRTEPEVIPPDSTADMVFTLDGGSIAPDAATFDYEVYIGGTGRETAPSKRSMRLHGEMKPAR